MPDPIQLQVIQKMKEVFEAAAPGTVALTGLSCLLGPATSRGGKSVVLSILTPSGTYDERLASSKVDRNMQTEFRCLAYAPRGVEPLERAAQVLADVEEIVVENETWGGLAIQTRLGAYEIIVEDTADRLVDVTLFATVTYRTRRDDPRNQS